MSFLKKVLICCGVESDSTGHAEKVISAVGGFIGILLAMWVSLHFAGTQGAVLLTASMGASAVLLFAVPHGTLSQPWPLIGGHVVSALIGVACAQAFVNPLIAAPLSVALAIAAMHYLRCIHPPGGATAITAVIGGSEVHALGYQFVLTPVLLNAAILLLAAVALNYAFPWRRYPAILKKQTDKNKVQRADTLGKLSHGDFEYARGEIGSYVDITEDDLARIYELAVKHAQFLSAQSGQITIGHFYSNGEYGVQWSVRQVVELSGDVPNEDAVVAYMIVAGDGHGTTNTSTLADFANWMRHEVKQEKGSWRRVKAI